MKVYDRIKKKTIALEELSKGKVDLGRFFFIDNENKHIELTSLLAKKYGTEIVIKDELLNLNEEENPHYQILCAIKKQMLLDFKSTFPLIQDIMSSTNLTKFEDMLFNEMEHFVYIFHKPYAQLNRKEEKVNVARAKRIPSKGFQFLSSHTEEWFHNSILDFQPRRVLHEELEESYDVYENRILFAFIERAIFKLKKRLVTLEKNEVLIKSSLIENLDSNQWSEKNDRTFRLAGKAVKYGGKVSHNNENIAKIRKILRTLMMFYSCPINDEVNKPLARKTKWHMTNCLSSDKHYKCLNKLWLELKRQDEVVIQKDAMSLHQEIVTGLRSYVESIIIYGISESLRNDFGREGYIIEGESQAWEAIHDVLPTININYTKYDTLLLHIADEDPLEIIVIGNYISDRDEILELLNKNPLLYILCYVGHIDSINERISHSRIIEIDAYKTISVENVIKNIIIKHLLKKLHRDIEKTFYVDYSNHSLRLDWRDYISLFDSNYILANSSTSYKYINYPDEPLNIFKIKQKIKETVRLLSKYSKESQKKEVLNIIEKVIADINRNNEIYRKKLYCPHCGRLLSKYDFHNLNYIRCEACLFSVEIQGDELKYHSTDEYLSDISDADSYFGLDYLHLV